MGNTPGAFVASYKNIEYTNVGYDYLVPFENVK